MITYSATLKMRKQESSRTVNQIESGYNLLQNKDSQYAREVKALLDLYKLVDQVWRTAPNEVKP